MKEAVIISLMSWLLLGVLSEVFEDSETLLKLFGLSAIIFTILFCALALTT